jgi:pimeloyl-ACP methyl ester carboxylesterase
MAVFVLVHGMFHGAWSWVRVEDALKARGHSVISRDLAGCGSDRTPVAEVSLDRWVADTVQSFKDIGEPVILVGHSRGGIVISQASEAAADHVAANVYFTALMLPNGLSGFGLAELLAEDGIANPFPIVPRFSEDGAAMLPPENAPDLFYGCCTEADRDWALPQMGPEPIAPSLQPLALTPENYGRVPRFYIAMTEDRTIPLAVQRAMIARAQPIEVTEIAGDHMANMTHAEELADILDEVARRYPAKVAA